MSILVRPFHVTMAARTVERGGVIAYPTEGVWGLGCDPFDYDAVRRILQLKQRPMHKGLILVAAEIAQLGAAVENLQKTELDQLSATPDYPLTWLIPDNGCVPYWITGGAGTLAVRITSHPLVAALCNRLDSALVSTSANPAGKAAARSAMQVRRYFKDELDYLLPGDLLDSNGASEIRELRSGKVLRARGS